MEMSQRQKAQQVAQQLPPSGPNGELRFQPDAQNPAQEQIKGEPSVLLTSIMTPSALDRGLKQRAIIRHFVLFAFLCVTLKLH